MSFLLLKSKSRSSRSTSSYRGVKQHRSSSSSSSTNDRNPSIASRSGAGTNSSNSFSSRISNSNAKQIHAGGGQVQLQRAQKQQQRRQVNVNRQQQSSEQHRQEQQESQSNDVISMDEVMEDLRVLEQQQRDSQRLLASIKLTKTHKIEQRVSLETKLSSLKYSNGEARAQILRARDVLSKSTRELGAARLHSERSSDNLKRFDDKLKRTLGHVRGLHAKHRQVEQAIVKLRNADVILSQRQRTMVEKFKSKEMERDDAKHREKLLLKTIQSTKMKAQELVDNTMKMRSELSELEGDLTIAQQMEASTKFRADSVSSDINNEHKRHEEAKRVIQVRIDAVRNSKIEIEHKIRDSTISIDMRRNALNEAFEKCVQFQKEDGLELSTSPKTAAIDIERIRGFAADEESNLLATAQEEAVIVERMKDLERQILEMREQSQNIEIETSNLEVQISNEKEQETNRVLERETFLTEFKKEREAVEDLRSTTIQFEKEQERDRKASIEHQNGQKALIDDAETKLEYIKDEIVSSSNDFESLMKMFEEEKVTSKAEIEEAKNHASETKTKFDLVQKEVDSLPATHLQTDKEIAEIVQAKEIKLSDMKKVRAKLLEDFPCLASLDFSYDESKSDEDQINSALSDLRNECQARINAAREEKERLLEEARIKAADEERTRLAQLAEEEQVKLVKQAKERALAEQKETERLLEQERIEAANRERERLVRQAEEEERLKKQAEEEERLAREEEEFARAKALADEKVRKKTQAIERARAKALVEEKERKKAEAIERARSEALVEEKARKKAEVIERARAKALVEEKARKKAEAIERARSEALEEEKARKRDRDQAKALQLKAKKKTEAIERAKEKTRKKGIEDERKKAEAKVKAKQEVAARMKAEAKAKAKQEAAAKKKVDAEVKAKAKLKTAAKKKAEAKAKVDYVDSDTDLKEDRSSRRSRLSTSESAKRRNTVSSASQIKRLSQDERRTKASESRKKRVFEAESSSHPARNKAISKRAPEFKSKSSSSAGDRDFLIRERSQNIGQKSSSKDILRKTSVPREVTKSNSIGKKKSSLKGKVNKSDVPSSAGKKTLSQFANRTEKKDAKIEHSRRSQAKVQKLDIFSSSDRLASKRSSSSTSRNLSKRKELSRSSSKLSQDPTKRAKTQKSRLPSQSQATIASKKSSSSTRRRKKIGGISGKRKSTESSSMDMDFSFM